MGTAAAVDIIDPDAQSRRAVENGSIPTRLQVVCSVRSPHRSGPRLAGGACAMLVRHCATID